MSWKIGIDFDHTIACYEFALGGPKLEVKNALLNLPNGEMQWQRLQGELYGKRMPLATVYAGFYEFIALARLRDCEICVVSHKSEFGHFDESKTPLRQVAREWLVANGISLVPYFESTRAEKIAKIRELKLTHFIDDLKEVLEEPEFPEDTQKIHFTPTANTWRKISWSLFEGWTDREIAEQVRVLWPELEIETVSRVPVGANAQVYRLLGAHGDYALKIYPDLGLDSRKRLETEYEACRVLTEHGSLIPCPVARSERLNWAVYSWIEGKRKDTVDEDFIQQSIEFIARLKDLSRLYTPGIDFQGASEACMSFQDILTQIDRRVQKLRAVNFPGLSEFMVEFLKTYKQCQNTENFASSQILSLSDMGLHNAIQGSDGKYVFYDLEYFGWDDPVKLTADFYWHPAMNLNQELRRYWLQQMKALFSDDELFSRRLESRLKLFGLRWCLIILNHINVIQLKKARDLLEQVYGSTF